MEDEYRSAVAGAWSSGDPCPQPAPSPAPPAAVQIAIEASGYHPGGTHADNVRNAVAALAAVGLLDPDARLREAVAALRAKTDQHGGVPWLEPELSAVFAALAAAPAAHPPEYVAALKAVAEAAREVSNWHAQADETYASVFDDLNAALDAAPTETGEQLAARLTDRMRARDTAGSGEA